MNRFGTIITRALRGLLGIFILWQVIYLFSSLLLNLEEALAVLEMRWPWTFHEAVRNGLGRYGELTHQPQNWSLFAPVVAEEFAFFDVELRWDDEGLEPGSVAVSPDDALPAVMLRAKNEPEDVNAFVRLSGFRMRKYETFLTPSPVPYEVMFGEVVGDWQPAFPVYEQADHMLAYLRWQLAEFRRGHPDLPAPSQVALWMHMYHIPKPPGPQPWRFEEGDIVCLGRWLPPADALAAKDEGR